VIVSRGEMVEIGDGFRLPDLIASDRRPAPRDRDHEPYVARRLRRRDRPGHRLHPQGASEQLPGRGFHRRRVGAELAGLGVPVVADIGSGLLTPDPLLPDEPDAATTLRDGAAVVTCSGDKLLGGPQAGLILGEQAVVERLRRHPLARALRVDKLTLAALEATLRGPETPTWTALRGDPDQLRERARRLAEAVGGELVCSDGTVGGGGAPGVRLPGWAVALPEANAEPLRRGDPAVIGRVERGAACSTSAVSPPEQDRVVVRRGPGHPARRRRSDVRCMSSRRPGTSTTASRPLVRALTGMGAGPVRGGAAAGLTIELGYAWTTLIGGEETIAFVDVPGHERFFATMLAGLGPAPAGMFVVAADEGWRQQSTEHLAAVTRWDWIKGCWWSRGVTWPTPDRRSSRP
jgi:hypothetical protein